MTPGELARLAAALDSDELALAAHVHISELPLVTAARALGWTVHRVDRTRKRLQRKFDKFARSMAPPGRRVIEEQPQFSYPQFLERLASGHRLWSMRALPRTYLDVLRAETPITEYSKQLEVKEVSRTSKGRGENMKSVDQLRQQLPTERGLLNRISDRVHKTRLAMESAELGLSKAEEELQADQVAAVLEERSSPPPELRKKLAGLQNAFHNTKIEFVAAQTAHRLQAQKVEDIESEITARRHEAFAAKLKSPAAELAKLMDQLVTKALECSEIAKEHGIDGTSFAQHLFPVVDPRDPIAGSSSRATAAGLFNSAIAHSTTKWQRTAAA